MRENKPRAIEQTCSCGWVQIQRYATYVCDNPIHKKRRKK